MNLIISKICSKCGLEKPISEFNKDKNHKDGLQTWCKECYNHYHDITKQLSEKTLNRIYYHSIGKKQCSKCKLIKDFKEFNKNKNRADGYFHCCRKCEKIRLNKYFKSRYWNNREKLLKINKIYTEKHKEQKSLYDKIYYQKNKIKIKKYNKTYRQSTIGKEQEIKHQSKRRNLEFNPLNKPFEGSVFHHLTNKYGAYIPEYIHLQCLAGKNTRLHRKRVFTYYGSLQNIINNTPQK
jgi:hypothetical protein